MAVCEAAPHLHRHRDRRRLRSHDLGHALHPPPRLAEGIDGLTDCPRSGRPTVLDRETVERILFLTTERVPREATHWSTRLMARYANYSRS